MRLQALCALTGALALSACAISSGVRLAAIPQAPVAASYIPLHGSAVLGLETKDGAATAIGGGVAVTNAHNANLLAGVPAIGESKDYDLLFFRNARPPVTEMAEPELGETVSAFGQGADGDLRMAHGVVKTIQTCIGCTAPAYFTFAGDAGPGFSGGPVLDASGRLIGITFGYKQEGGSRMIYAYPMNRVRAELFVIHGEAK